MEFDKMKGMTDRKERRLVEGRLDTREEMNVRREHTWEVEVRED